MRSRAVIYQMTTTGELHAWINSGAIAILAITILVLHMGR